MMAGIRDHHQLRRGSQTRVMLDDLGPRHIELADDEERRLRFVRAARMAVVSCARNAPTETVRNSTSAVGRMRPPWVEDLPSCPDRRAP
jgi:hypothetical protein